MSATGTWPARKTGDELEALIRDAEEIPTIPESLLQIMMVLDDPDSGPSDLAQVVRHDAPLMSKILRVANSPYYKNPGTISDINRCVAVLGYRTVRQMTLTISVATSLVAAAAEAGGNLDYRELWRHSVVVGAMAKELASWMGYAEPEEVFTAGLMHDIGKFILEITATEQYDVLLYRRAKDDENLVSMEREIFGFDHAAIGEAFCRVWTLSPRLTAAIGYHHGAAPDHLGLHEGMVCSLVRLADYLANTMTPPASDLGFNPKDADPGRLCAACGLGLNELESRLPELRSSVELAADFLNLD